MDSRFDTREMGSSMSKPTDARSSAMAAHDAKAKHSKNTGLGQINNCKFLLLPFLSTNLL